MGNWSFTREDLLQAGGMGISEATLWSQIETFKKSNCFMRLLRPAILGDGVMALTPEAAVTHLGRQEQAARNGRFLRFVPASGAATRMFQALLQLYHRHPERTLDEIEYWATRGEDCARDAVTFFKGLKRLSLYEDLRACLARDQIDAEQLIRDGHWQVLLDYLLNARGLHYGALPKGLISFHRYADGNRTPFEEHLAEAAHTARSADGTCRLHFTVAAEHEARFRALLEQVRASYEAALGVRFEVTFSVQKPATDTLAVTLDDRPFRDRSGRLVFRPGGHGALLENLNDLGADLVYIKNIDNVVPDRLKEPVVFWKRVLGGVLLEVENLVHGFLKELEGTEASRARLAEIAEICRGKLSVTFPKGFFSWGSGEQQGFLVRRLNRPLRVCGMVENVKEPGGGPFWVEGVEGLPSLQIVESAQVDVQSPEQRRIWQSSTHFNPVDIVCSLRDYRGKAFDLHRHVDAEAVFIARKSKEGRELKALELPGLWNGAMSDWLTIFVEVPRATFQPVKTVNALLNPEHQPQ
jgi:hypothetical protein